MWKIIGYIGVGLLIIALCVGLTIKITQKAEGYKADTQNFYSFEYHPFLGGCARYDAFRQGNAPAQEKQVKNNQPAQTVNKEAKK